MALANQVPEGLRQQPGDIVAVPSLAQKYQFPQRTLVAGDVQEGAQRYGMPTTTAASAATAGERAWTLQATIAVRGEGRQLVLALPTEGRGGQGSLRAQSTAIGPQ